MPEIERKFRVTWLAEGVLRDGVNIVQGYLSLVPEIRVRLKGGEAFITVKGKGDLVRLEFEYPIPSSDVDALLTMIVGRPIRKTRHMHDSWEIDIYKGHLEGLMTAEIELSSSTEEVTLPEWMRGYDVTYDCRYRNQRLALIHSLSVLDEPLDDPDSTPPCAVGLVP